MHIRLAEKNDQHAWDEYVLWHERSGPYHLFAWRQAVEKAYHHSPRYLIAENEAGKIKGVLPLILVKPPFLRGHLVSLPFCDYGGVLAQDNDVTKLLIRRALELARSFRSKLEIRCKATDPSLQVFPGISSTSHKVRMVLSLPEGSEILWTAFRSKLRSQVRRPQKDGMEFRMGSDDLLDDFYKVFSRNMRELGSPVHSKEWIGSVIDAYQDNSHVGVVYQGETPVAGGIIFGSKDTVTIPWASALSAYSKSSPNMLLYWGFLEYASDNGFRFFDFGRSTPGEGTYVFKEQWGARPAPLYWYSEGSDSVRGAASKTGNFRQLAEALWPRLPGVLVNTLGPLIRGYITL